VLRTLYAGLALAVGGALALIVGDALGWDLAPMLFVGVGTGAALGLVSGSSPLAKVGGFAIGIVAAAIGYVLRAAVLPDSTGGRAVAIVVVVLAATLLVMATAGRLPLWSAFLGVGALGGAYEETFADSPGSILSTMPSALTSLLIVAAIAFAATLLFAESAADGEEEGDRHERPTPDDPVEQDVSLDEVLSRGGN
jgi:hypothetical protein